MIAPFTGKRKQVGLIEAVAESPSEYHSAATARATRCRKAQ
jgi:hypothetical protein